MRERTWVKENKREFFRNHRRTLRKINKLVKDLDWGSALFPELSWHREIEQIEDYIEQIDLITKRGAGR